MGTLQLSDSFRRSYENFEYYPQNLVHRTSYLGALRAYTTRLDNATPKLFTKKDAEVFVPSEICFLPVKVWCSQAPFSSSTLICKAFERQKILNDAALKEWLGDPSAIDPNTSTCIGALATGRDPRCRFMSVHQRILGCDKIVLTGGGLQLYLWGTLASTPQHHAKDVLMPNYLDFVSVFGSQALPRELRFSSFREQILLSSPPRGPAVPDLGRSGRQFQLCYNLKAVTCLSDANTATKSKEWSIRQAAFHHQFDVEEGTTLWIVTQGSLDLKNRVQEMTGKDGRPEDRAFRNPEECFRSSLAIHLLYCHWSTEEWRWYIQWLEDVIDQELAIPRCKLPSPLKLTKLLQTHIAVYGPRGPGEAQRIYTPGDLQILQNYEDSMNEAIMVLEANVDILTSLRNFYEGLVRTNDFPFRDTCHGDVVDFAVQLNDMVYDARMQILRTKLLLRITDDRKNLVLQHLQSQATEKMEILTINMHKIGVMSQKEAIIMRIITVVTLIYLPATFLSTFFSTDVIKYQSSNDAGGNSSILDQSKTFKGSFSETALFRWLQVTVPLTALTLLVGFVFFKIADRNRKREWLPYHLQDHKASLR
ncbi:MAG: hypothetical protein M1816_005082 [Peltula sp. TS41687]|nr:MAG: hypothetical protein M1816_005082 [Peltula sp. TS41687]